MTQNIVSVKQAAIAFLHACITTKDTEEILKGVTEDIFWMGANQKWVRGKAAVASLMTTPQFEWLPMADVVYHTIEETVHNDVCASICAEFTVLWETAEKETKHASFGCTILFNKENGNWLVSVCNHFPINTALTTTNSLPVGICYIQNFQIVYGNSYFYQLLGLGPADTASINVRTLADFVDPRDIEQVQSNLQSAVFFRQQNATLEFRVKSRLQETVWLHAKCSCDAKDTLTLALIDITKRHLQEQAVLMREEEFRIALQQHTNKLIFRYDIAEKKLLLPEYYARKMNQPSIIHNAPESILTTNFVAKQSKKSFQSFFDAMLNGEPSGSTILSVKNDINHYRWYHADYSLLYDDNHEPVRAIITYEDVTEKQERELAYQKWQRYNESQLADCLGYYECNLTRNLFDRIDGPLAAHLPSEVQKSYTSVMQYAAQYFIHAQSRQQYQQFFDREELLAKYYSGARSLWLEHRRMGADGNSMWCKASIQLLPDPYSNDIKGFVLIKNFERQKQATLSYQMQVRYDTLTGALNHATFLAEITKKLQSDSKTSNHALIAIDIDHFKKLNNHYGYLTGDAILTETFKALEGRLPSNALIGRVGGDEFMVFLHNIPTSKALEETIFALQSVLSIYVELENNRILISCSMGIVLCPQDGDTFAVLNQKVSAALQEAKKLGGNNIIAYSPPVDENTPGYFARTAEQESHNISFLTPPENDYQQKLPVHPLQYGYDIALRFAYDGLFLCHLVNDNYHIVFNRLPERFKTLQRESLQRTLDILCAKIIHPHDVPWLKHCFSKEQWKDMLHSGFDHRTIEIRALSQKQQYNWYQLVLVAQNTPGGDIGLYCFITDISENKKTEELRHQLQTEASRYRIIVEKSSTLVLEWNEDNESYYTSPTAKRFTFSQNTEKNRNETFLTPSDVHPEDWPQARVFLQAIRHGDNNNDCTIRLKIHSGEYIWCKLLVTILRNSIGAVSRSIITIDDIDESVKDRKSLQYRAEYDSLTGYINYERFKSDVSKILHNRDGLKYSVWYCDIKNFKFVNDIYGYETGDLVLQKWAKILADDTRPGESCARISADHFAALRYYTNREELVSRFQSAADLLWNFKELSEKKFRLELVTGIYCIEHDEDIVSIEDMIDRANIAQKSVKPIAGSRYAFYTKAMRDHIIQEKAIEADMPNALRNREFCFYLQPQVDIQNGNTIMGAEALVRWKKPDGSIVPPNMFIPLFEKNGFIVELDLYVFHEVCRYIASRMEKGLDLFKISVNASRISVFQNDFAKRYIAIKNKYGIPDHLLQMECTETTVVENLKMLDSIMETMRQNGFLFALDDFGAGYSSLNMLKDVSADELKLDMVFVHNGLHNMKETAIVSSVISMAQKIGMKTVAEGVESREQLHALQALNCDIVQGYLFGRPLPVEEFEAIFDYSPNHETFVE